MLVSVYKSMYSTHKSNPSNSISKEVANQLSYIFNSLRLAPVSDEDILSANDNLPDELVTKAFKSAVKAFVYNENYRTRFIDLFSSNIKQLTSIADKAIALQLIAKATIEYLQKREPTAKELLEGLPVCFNL